VKPRLARILMVVIQLLAIIDCGSSRDDAHPSSSSNVSPIPESIHQNDGTNPTPAFIPLPQTNSFVTKLFWFPSEEDLDDQASLDLGIILPDGSVVNKYTKSDTCKYIGGTSVTPLLVEESIDCHSLETDRCYQVQVVNKKSSQYVPFKLILESTKEGTLRNVGFALASEKVFVINFVYKGPEVDWYTHENVEDLSSLILPCWTKLPPTLYQLRTQGAPQMDKRIFAGPLEGYWNFFQGLSLIY